MTPAEFIRRKKTCAVALTTAQVDSLSQEFREAAAWIVGVEEASIIKTYYRAAEQLLTGKLSDAEARRLVRETLEAAGYRADKPGSWGDLANGTARQKLILDTNVKKAAGYAWHQTVQGSRAFPAQRLVRMGARRAPRDWAARWRKAWAELPPEEKAHAHPTQMVATTNCAIWRGISRWGDPYPPFDYGSGMDVLPVDADTARALGILGEGAAAPAAAPAATPAAFRHPQALPEGLLPDIRVELEGWIADALA